MARQLHIETAQSKVGEYWPQKCDVFSCSKCSLKLSIRALQSLNSRILFYEPATRRLLREKQAESKLEQLQNLIDEGEASEPPLAWNAREFILRMKMQNHGK
ncbi:MAG: hypothetical protein GW760_00800 [Legionella sp.]|nr:hypothetical protein [Legionella sp.]